MRPLTSVSDKMCTKKWCTHTRNCLYYHTAVTSCQRNNNALVTRMLFLSFNETPMLLLSKNIGQIYNLVSCRYRKNYGHTIEREPRMRPDIKQRRPYYTVVFFAGLRYNRGFNQNANKHVNICSAAGCLSECICCYLVNLTPNTINADEYL